MTLDLKEWHRRHERLKKNEQMNTQTREYYAFTKENTLFVWKHKDRKAGFTQKQRGNSILFGKKFSGVTKGQRAHLESLMIFLFWQWEMCKERHWKLTNPFLDIDKASNAYFGFTVCRFGQKLLFLILSCKLPQVLGLTLI